MSQKEFNISHLQIDGEKAGEKVITLYVEINDNTSEVLLNFSLKQNLCRLHRPEISGLSYKKSLEIVLDYLFATLPSDCDIWMCEESVSTEIREFGFHCPFYVKKCPFGRKFDTPRIAVSRKNDPGFITNSRERHTGEDEEPEKFQERRSSPSRMLQKDRMFSLVEKTLGTSEPVELKLKFDLDDLEYLKSLVYGSKTINEDGFITQKEVSGVLCIEDFKIKIDKSKKFNAHDEWLVRFVNGLINFHTHPIEVYETLNTDLMYPSPGDYTSILTFLLQRHFFEKKQGSLCPILFSCVFTQEGVYIVSLNKNYCTKKRVDELRKILCDENDHVFLKPGVQQAINSKDRGVSGFYYGKDRNPSHFYETHCKFIGDPVDHPLGYHQVGGFDFDTHRHNRSKSQVSHFPESVKMNGEELNPLEQAAKDYCLKINRRELLSGTKFTHGPVLNVQFYTYGELQKTSFSVYTYPSEMTK